MTDGNTRILFLPALSVVLSACVEYGVQVFDSVDIFQQEPASQLDALLVVDNSYSMGPYQESLAQNFNEFISLFTSLDVDYHIGVVTTTVGEVLLGENWDCTEAEIQAVPGAGELVDDTFITPETTDPQQLFSDLVNVGTCGSVYEMGMEAAHLALTSRIEDGTNAGFLREQASLSLVFVSDEEDGSPMSVGSYIDAFRELKSGESRDVFNASAMVVVDPESCSQDQVSSVSGGTRYIDIAQRTDGVVGDLCSGDFSGIVTDISASLARYDDTFYLSHMPDPATLQLSLDDQEVDCHEGQWSYSLLDLAGISEPAIIFQEEYIPAPSTRIVLRYYWGDGDEEDFCP